MEGSAFAFAFEATIASDGRRSKAMACAAIGGTAGSGAGRPVGPDSPLQLRANRPTTQTISVFGSSTVFFAQHDFDPVFNFEQQDSGSTIAGDFLPVEQQQGAVGLMVKQPHDLPQRSDLADGLTNAGNPTSETSWAQTSTTARAGKDRGAIVRERIIGHGVGWGVRPWHRMDAAR